MKMTKPLRSILSAIFRTSIGSPPPSKEGLERALQPPHDDTRDILHGVEVHDHFRPLEKLEAKETRDWIARENNHYDQTISTPAAKEAEARANAFFAKASPTGGRESMPERCGDKYLVRRKAENEKRPSYYLKDVPDYGAPAQKVLDPAVIDPSGKTAIKFVKPTPDGKILAYALSVSGADKSTLKFFDVETGKDLDLSLPDFQTNVNKTIKWDQDGKGFYYYATNPADKSSEVYYHKMGTDIAADKLVYSPKEAECGGEFYMISNEKGEPGAYEYIAKYKAINVDETDKVAILVRPRGSDGEFREIFPMKEGLIKPIREVGGRLLAITNYKSPTSKLVSIDVNDPSPDKWQTILPGTERDPLKDAFVWQDKIFATYGHNSGEMLRVFGLDGKHLHDAPIPPLSTFELGTVSPNDTKVPISYSNFHEDGGVYNYDSVSNKMDLLKASDMPIDLKDCIVEQIEATSKDGTKIPMTVIRGRDTKLDGTAATLLYGYGGFNVPLEPAFNPGIAQWVREGGIYVRAHLRGGGEFGQDWYDGGRLKNKQNVFDDYAAAAECLIGKNYTCSKRMAAHGGSNGGLLTLATVLQHPTLFGAVVSEVPVADMFRFHIGSFEGFSWKSDYGDPDVKEDFNTSAKYSPLHYLIKCLKHCPLLIKTDINDDRVLPWHALKMAATMQAHEDKDSVTLLKVRTDGGHSAGMTEAQRFADIASVRGFLAWALGPINQDEYKAQLQVEKKPAAKSFWKFGRG